MNEAAKEKQRAYHRKWQQEHRDKVKKYQSDYWNRKAEQETAAAAAQDQNEQEAQEC